jgi:hypothetical protein
VAYRRDRPGDERIWSVAFTVPVVVSEEPGAKPIGVVGMTISLANAPDDQKDRFAVLIDTRPDAKNQRRGLILRHPYWSAMDNENDPPLYYADAVVKWSDAAAVANNDRLPFEAGEWYIDPVSLPSGDSPGMEKYEGTWLASVHRVRVGPEQVDTGWVVLVQERRDVTLQPVRDLQWRLGYVALAATASVLVLVALMWAGMIAVMNTTPRSPVTRLLRRWAGLPTTSTTGTIGSTAGGSSLPAAMTARGTDAGTPTGAREQKTEDR